MTVPTAVVLRAIGLGDMLTGLPAMALLRRALPRHRIVGAVPGRYAGTLVRAGLLDEVLPTSSLQPLRGAPVGPDIAVDLHGNGPPSRDLLHDLRPRRLVAFVRRGDDVPPRTEASLWDDDEHEVARWCRLLREHVTGVGESPPVWGLLPAPARVRSGATVVHPGAAAGSRRWPVDRWAAVARALTAAGHRVVVTGTPGEQGIVDAVARPAGAQTETRLDVDELFGLVAAARLVLSGDTGLAHMASAFGTPSVVLFGPVSPARWGRRPAPGTRRCGRRRIAVIGATRTGAFPIRSCCASRSPTSSPPRSARSRRAGQTEPTWARSPRAPPGWSVPVRRDRGESEQMTESLRAVLFDMDGTLVETEEHWGEALFALARRLGGRLSADARAATVGSSMRTSMEILHRDIGVTRSEAELLADARWVEDTTAVLLAEEIAWRPGAADLLLSVREAGLATALVTTTPRRLADIVLTAIRDDLGSDPFDLTICGDEVPARKPDPAPYRMAMEALGAPPAECVVIEDSHAGIAAGLAAGTAVLGVRRSRSAAGAGPPPPRRARRGRPGRARRRAGRRGPDRHRRLTDTA